MDEATRSKLDAIFAKDAAQKLEVQVKRDLEAEAQAEFLTKFLQYRASTLLPALEEFAAYIRSQGWIVNVSHGDERPQDIGARGQIRERGQAASAKIEYVRPGDEKKLGDLGHAFVQFGCVKSSREVGTHQSTISPGRGGSSGGPKCYAIDDLNPAFIETVLTSHFAQLFS